MIHKLPLHGPGCRQCLLIQSPRRVEPSVRFPRTVLTLPFGVAVSDFQLAAHLIEQLCTRGAVIGRWPRRGAAVSQEHTCQPFHEPIQLLCDLGALAAYLL